MIAFFSENQNAQNFFKGMEGVDELYLNSTSLALKSQIPNSINTKVNGFKIFIWGELYLNTKLRDIESLKELLNGCRTLQSFVGSIKEIEGHFACCVVNELNDDSVIFADKFGKTEIFFSPTNGGYILSLDLKPIMDSLSSVKMNQLALANFFSVYGYYAPKKETIYQSVKRLDVGEACFLTDRKISFRTEPLGLVDMEEMEVTHLEEYAHIFQRSVEKRASESENWIYLSSGWDSSSILAVLAKNHSSSSIRAVIGNMDYSERVDGINEFEISRARKLADYFKVDLEIVDFNLRSEDSIAYFQSISEQLRDQHIYSFSSFNFYKLAEHVEVNGSEGAAIFAGEISDGIHNFGFSQSATILEHPNLEFREYSDKMISYLFSPSFFELVKSDNFETDFVFRSLSNRLGSFNSEYFKKFSTGEKVKDFLLSMFISPLRMPFSQRKGNGMVTPNGIKEHEEYIWQNYFKTPADNVNARNLYSFYLNQYNRFHWQGGSVRCFNAPYHQMGKRTAFPFWDAELYAFLQKMPENFGRSLEMRPTKYPLKWTLENKLDYPMYLQNGPHSYLYDVDPGFNHVAEILYGSKLKNWFKDMMTEQNILDVLDEKIFNFEYIERLIVDYQNGIEHEGQMRSDTMSIALLSSVGFYN